MNSFSKKGTTTIPEKIETLILEDGFYYFDPQPNLGVFSAHHLREIANKLDEMNEPWEKEIANYFAFNSNA